MTPTDNALPSHKYRVSVVDYKRRVHYFDCVRVEQIQLDCSRIKHQKRRHYITNKCNQCVLIIRLTELGSLLVL